MHNRVFLAFEDFFWLLVCYSELRGSDSFSCCPCVCLRGALQTWWDSTGTALPTVPVRAAGAAPVTQPSTEQVLQPRALLAAVQPPAAGTGSEHHSAAVQGHTHLKHT